MSLPNHRLNCNYIKAVPVGVGMTSYSKPAEPLYWTSVFRQFTHSYNDYYGTQTQTCYYTIPGLARMFQSHPALVVSPEKVTEWHKDAVVQNNIVHFPKSLDKTSPTVALNVQGGTRILTSKEVEGFDIVLSMPQGIYQVSTSKGFVEHEVSVAVLYRKFQPDSPNGTWTVVEDKYIISGTQRAEILKTIKAGRNLPMAVYEILVFRHTEDHTGSAVYVDDIYVKEITEIVYSQLQYNHTALLGLRIRATDQLHQQLPTVTSLVKGIKVLVPENLATAYE